MPADSGATVTMALNGEIMLGSTATWDDGENDLEISVMNGGASKMYIVVVTKE